MECTGWYLILAKVGEGIGVGVRVEADGLLPGRCGGRIEVVARGGVSVDAGTLEDRGDLSGYVGGHIDFNWVVARCVGGGEY